MVKYVLTRPGKKNHKVSSGKNRCYADQSMVAVSELWCTTRLVGLANWFLPVFISLAGVPYILWFLLYKQFVSSLSPSWCTALSLFVGPTKQGFVSVFWYSSNMLDWLKAMAVHLTVIQLRTAHNLISSPQLQTKLPISFDKQKLYTCQRLVAWQLLKKN